MSLFVYEVFQVDYIQVENGEVKGYPQPLPRNWADVSNFYLLDDVQVLSYGWYPVRFVPAEKTDNDVVTGQSFVIEENEVVQYEQIRPKTESEIQEELNSKWENIRNQRNLLLSESDWTQLPDSPLTPEKKTEWSSYRQQLRDVTSQLDPNNIIWPTKP
jgi:hypothetical protein